MLATIARAWHFKDGTSRATVVLFTCALSVRRIAFSVARAVASSGARAYRAIDPSPGLGTTACAIPSIARTVTSTIIWAREMCILTHGTRVILFAHADTGRIACTVATTAIRAIRC